MKFEFYDASNRDGDQSCDVNLKPWQKIELALALDRLDCDSLYCEMGWEGSNPVDKQVFKLLKGVQFKHVTPTVFGSTRKAGIRPEQDKSLQSIVQSGVKVATIFGKSNERHVHYELETTLEENLQMVHDSVSFLKSKGLTVFFDAEHFFDGFRRNPAYALSVLSTAAEAGAERLVLCDTNGGTLPNKMPFILGEVNKYLESRGIKTPIGIHCHNDYGNAVSNSVNAPFLGKIAHIQGCINGIGERSGNADLISIIANIMIGYDADDWDYLSRHQIEKPNLELSLLKELSDFFYSVTGVRQNPRQPIAGSLADTDGGGVHRNATRKKAGLYRPFDLALVGNSNSTTAFSSQIGSAHILDVAERLNYPANKNDLRIKAAMEEAKQMSAEGYNIRFLEAEQELLLMRHFGLGFPLSINYWHAATESRNGTIRSKSELCVLVSGRETKRCFEVEGNGPFNAMYTNLQDIVGRHLPSVREISLEGFSVSTVDGVKGKGPASPVRVYAEFRDGIGLWGTVGVSTNILEASLEALVKGFNYYLLRKQ